MKKKVKFSKRTTALIVAAVLLFAGGGVAGTRAALNIQSELYRAHFYLNHLQVHLLENGKDVCGEKNDLDGSSKVTGNLATSLGYEGIDKQLGTIEPGKLYEERIAARNGNNIDEFVRLTIRKYWVQTEKAEDGTYTIKIDEETGEPAKAENMDPAWIHLTYEGSEDGNTGAWAENKSEATAESRTFYYRKDLDPKADSAELFDKIMIDKQVAKLGKVDEKKEGNKTVYTYIYKYDGCAFFIEADVQAIQTHNAKEAIKSQWGVDATVDYSDPAGNGNGSGSLKVGN